MARLVGSPDGKQWYMRFGIHKGKTIRETIIDDKDYVVWA